MNAKKVLQDWMNNRERAALPKKLHDGMKRLDNGQNIPSKEWIAYVCALQDRKGLPLDVFALMDAVGAPDVEKLKRNAIPNELYVGWDALSKQNKLKAIRDNDYTLYSVLYNDKFNGWPQDKGREVDYNVKELYQQKLREYKCKTMNSMSWDDLNKANLVGLLQKLDREAYKDKYFDKFGVRPKF